MKNTVLALLAVGTLAACGGRPLPDGGGVPYELKVTNVSSSVISTMRNHWTKSLKDPLSVQWGEYQTGTFKNPWGERYASMCGLYNAKNGFGGYVGFKHVYIEMNLETNQVTYTRASNSDYPAGQYACQRAGYSV